MKIYFSVIFIFAVLFCSNIFTQAKAEEFNINNNLLSYSSASSLKSEISRMESKIRYNKRKISSIRYSNKISEYDKKRQISRLESENRTLKRKIDRIRYEYRRAIS